MVEKPITSLPDNDSCKKKILQISPLAKKVTRWLITSINRLRLGNLPFKTLYTYSLTTAYRYTQMHLESILTEIVSRGEGVIPT